MYILIIKILFASIGVEEELAPSDPSFRALICCSFTDKSDEQSSGIGEELSPLDPGFRALVGCFYKDDNGKQR